MSALLRLAMLEQQLGSDAHPPAYPDQQNHGSVRQGMCFRTDPIRPGRSAAI